MLCCSIHCYFITQLHRLIALLLYLLFEHIQSTELTLSKTSSTNTPSKKDVVAIGYNDASPTMYLAPQNYATKVKHMKKK